jgi:hypothetical protein
VAGSGGTGVVTGGSGGSPSPGFDAGMAGSGEPVGVGGGRDGASSSDAPGPKPGNADGGGGDGIPDSDFLPGRPDIRLCKKEWTTAQCCAFLCSCLNTICADSPKGKPGLASCMSWCPNISSMAQRCHVYHCYISISPTGGINDHDSHCGHAANQVQGGGCPTAVYQQ